MTVSPADPDALARAGSTIDLLVETPPAWEQLLDLLVEETAAAGGSRHVEPAWLAIVDAVLLRLGRSRAHFDERVGALLVEEEAAWLEGGP